MSVRSSWFTTLFKSLVFSLICLDVLATFMVEPSISPFSAVDICFIYFHVLLFAAYMFEIIISSSWIDFYQYIKVLLCQKKKETIFDFKSVLSNIGTTVSLYWVIFTWNIFSILLLCVLSEPLADSIQLHHAVFKLSFAHLCLLIGNFNPVTFKVTADKKELTSAILLLFSVSFRPYFLSFPPLVFFCWLVCLFL